LPSSAHHVLHALLWLSQLCNCSELLELANRNILEVRTYIEHTLMYQNLLGSVTSLLCQVMGKLWHLPQIVFKSGKSSWVASSFGLSFTFTKSHILSTSAVHSRRCLTHYTSPNISQRLCCPQQGSIVRLLHATTHLISQHLLSKLQASIVRALHAIATIARYAYLPTSAVHGQRQVTSLTVTH
jgi:hypothetical protein